MKRKRGEQMTRWERRCHCRNRKLKGGGISEAKLTAGLPSSIGMSMMAVLQGLLGRRQRKG